MKSYTDLEQSKKLTEILPPESADMCYRIVAYNPNDTHEYQPYCFSSTLESDIPCWSLAALLSVLAYPHIKQLYDGNWVCRVENKDTTYLWTDSNPVDACYEMVIKLYEQNIL